MDLTLISITNLKEALETQRRYKSKLPYSFLNLCTPEPQLIIYNASLIRFIYKEVKDNWVNLSSESQDLIRDYFISILFNVILKLDLIKVFWIFPKCYKQLNDLVLIQLLIRTLEDWNDTRVLISETEGYKEYTKQTIRIAFTGSN